jgi:hypothetical protein
MGLFNFIYLTLFSELLLSDLSNKEISPYYFKDSSMKYKESSLRIISSPTDVQKQNINRKLLLATESVYRFGKEDPTKVSLFQYLINKYWEQTIFISVSTPLSKKYVGQLAKKDTAIIKNTRKLLLLQLSKALLNRKIDASTFATDNTHSKKPLLSVQHVWRKGFNIEPPNSWNKPFSSQRTPKFPDFSQANLLSQLKSNHLPVFTVVNGLKQLIVSEPAEQLIVSNKLGPSFYQWYHDRFVWRKDSNTIHEGWFFVNPQDAKEYKEYIASKYPRSSRQNRLNILSTGIDFYYQLNRTATPRIQFRLFPDLVEVGKLIKNAQHRQGLSFDSRQRYGTDYFQGQPIYLIEPISAKGYNQKSIHYYYQVPSDASKQKYNGIFLNKEVAIIAWQKFRTTMPEYKLPKSPKLRVYNLEDFIKDQESNQDANIGKFLLVPGLESYSEIIEVQNAKEIQTWFNKAVGYSSQYVLLTRLWGQRILWSLTSRQPPNW